MPKYIYVLACCIVQPSITTGSYAHIPLELNIISLVLSVLKIRQWLLYYTLNN